MSLALRASAGVQVVSECIVAGTTRTAPKGKLVATNRRGLDA